MVNVTGAAEAPSVVLVAVSVVDTVAEGSWLQPTVTSHVAIAQLEHRSHDRRVVWEVKGGTVVMGDNLEQGGRGSEGASF